MSASNTNDRSAGVAYLLWFFLGCFGAHRFYCGRKGSGFGMLGLCLGSFVTAPFVIGLLGFPALLVWWIVDAFLINGWLNGPPVAGTIAETDEEPAQAAA